MCRGLRRAVLRVCTNRVVAVRIFGGVCIRMIGDTESIAVSGISTIWLFVWVVWGLWTVFW